MNILNQLKLKWFVAANTLGYTTDYFELIYKIYLNHNKIIHYRDGHPVYSLSTPALFTKPAANFFGRTLFRSIQNKNLPNLMTFAVTDECNANCENCSFFTGVDDKSRKVLTLEQSKKLIKDAQELGVSIITFTGGEPLLRTDLPEIISSVDKNLSTTVLFTNGLLLADKARELKKMGLDSVYVSIDSADPTKHNLLKGKTDIFERALEGIQQAKSAGLSTGISCCITPESFRNKELEGIIELAKNIGVHEVLAFDAMPTGRYKHRTDLIDNDGWVEEMINAVGKYNSDASYPGVLVFAYTTSFRSVGCTCGTSYFYISPYGDMMSCDFNHAQFGNILETPLYQLWDAMTSMEDFHCAKWGGCKLKDSKYLTKNTVATSTGLAGCTVTK